MTTKRQPSGPPRPTRAQHRLLDYIEHFIKQHGYGPSYREIMRALDFRSVSTVAVHIDGLVAAGSLRKHGRSARSLEVVKRSEADKLAAAGDGETVGKVAVVVTKKPATIAEHEAWLAEVITAYADSPEANPPVLHNMAKTFAILGLKKAKKLAAERADAYLKQTD